MKKTLFFILCFLSAALLIGCSVLKPVIKPKSANMLNVLALPSYQGLKAKIIVASFDIKAAKIGSDLSAALHDLLTAMLVNSNRFNVVDSQVLGANADLIATVTVTEFEPGSSGGRSGIGGGGGVSSGRLGGLLGAGSNKAHMALNIRIVDAATSGILAVTASSIQSQASDVLGSKVADSSGGLAFSNALSAYANTPMEKAIRVCLIEAVRYIAQEVPAAYYKY